MCWYVVNFAPKLLIVNDRDGNLMLLHPDMFNSICNQVEVCRNKLRSEKRGKTFFRKLLNFKVFWIHVFKVDTV